MSAKTLLARQQLRLAMVAGKGINAMILTSGAFLMQAAAGQDELPWQFDRPTRYMVMGDSLGAGYGATPQTRGYAYQLYRSGVVGRVSQTLFCNASVIGATSADVLAYQVPLARVFLPNVVTLTVGGNDLTKILEGADSDAVLREFRKNLNGILAALVNELKVEAYLGNFYVVDRIPGAADIIPVINQILGEVAAAHGVPVADICRPFRGGKGLLLIEQPEAPSCEVHPTNDGHRAIARAFVDVIE